MGDFYVRWGDDVQPYMLQLASEHIDALRLYCEETVRRIIDRRTRQASVVALTNRVKPAMMKAKAFHRFCRLGFHFDLRENTKKYSGRKREFVLTFAAPPDFQPDDMPPRLRRVDGKPISAQPTGRRTRAARPVRPEGARRKRTKKSALERLPYRLGVHRRWTQALVAALTSSSSAKLYRMNDAYHRLSAQCAAMWRRRPRIGFARLRTSILTSHQEGLVNASAQARLEPRLTGESLGFLLFTFVTPHPAVNWGAYLFGRLSEEGERIPA